MSLINSVPEELLFATLSGIRVSGGMNFITVSAYSTKLAYTCTYIILYYDKCSYNDNSFNAAALV